MLVPFRHEGRYFLCRVLCPPTKRVAIEVGLISPCGRVIQGCFYNYPIKPLSLPPPTLADLDCFFSEGTFLAIKEPWVKMSCGDGDSVPILRVDSPTDIVFIQSDNKILENVVWKGPVWGTTAEPRRTVEDWKQLGNKVG